MIASEGVPRWAGGVDTAVAWPGGIALISAALPISVAERIWTRLHREPQLGTFLKTLAECTGSGFLDLPPFAIAVLDGPRCHVAVRGDVDVEVLVQQQIESLHGRGITTWAERVFINPQAVHLSRASTETDDVIGLPLADGVVPASSITLGERGESMPSAPPGAREDASAVSADPDVNGVEDEHAQPEPGQGRMASQGSASDSEATSHQAENSGLDPQETLADDDEIDVADGGSEEGELRGELSRANPYQSLWEESTAVDVEAAAVREERSEVGPEIPPGRMGISDQLSGQTVADEGQVVISMGAPEEPTVLARFCDRGHANPPEREDCFTCGSAVTGDARITGRPQLGWLRIGGGEAVALRGPVIAGRNPSTAALRGTEPARLLAIPHSHVSSNHLAIVLEGWRVMVRDLGSSNGTYLRRHGKPPIRLPEQSVPLVPGDLIDLGKGVFIHLVRIP